VRQVTFSLHESAGNFKPAIENHAADRVPASYAPAG
jgi:hypothetical protein